MIYLTKSSRIFLAIKPVDFRKQIDSLVMICNSVFSVNPSDGSVYGFINRKKTMVRFLIYDQNGYWLMTKRLSKGQYQYWPKDNQELSQESAMKLNKILSNEN